ncbi:MAG: hypothetical protein MJD61_00695 [Proteobacteria bacterium]|nr:hypothetical protein [Pseudomonadota bacterium]
MSARTVEDRLREQYADILPDVRRALTELEARVRYAIMPIALELKARYEQLVIRRRIKDCESAVAALRRRQEGKLFDPESSDDYSLVSLRDLAGLRVLVFPSGRIESVTSALSRVFPDWSEDHVRGEAENVIAHKFFGHCQGNDKIICEYQVVPMLVGLFWEVEHAAIYKPDQRLVGVTREPKMREKTQAVLAALTEFEVEFTALVEEAGARGSP